MRDRAADVRQQNLEHTAPGEPAAAPSPAPAIIIEDQIYTWSPQPDHEHRPPASIPVGELALQLVRGVAGMDEKQRDSALPEVTKFLAEFLGPCVRQDALLSSDAADWPASAREHWDSSGKMGINYVIHKNIPKRTIEARRRLLQQHLRSPLIQQLQQQSTERHLKAQAAKLAAEASRLRHVWWHFKLPPFLLKIAMPSAARDRLTKLTTQLFPPKPYDPEALSSCLVCVASSAEGSASGAGGAAATETGASQQLRSDSAGLQFLTAQAAAKAISDHRRKKCKSTETSSDRDRDRELARFLSEEVGLRLFFEAHGTFEKAAEAMRLHPRLRGFFNAFAGLEQMTAVSLRSGWPLIRTAMLIATLLAVQDGLYPLGWLAGSLDDTLLDSVFCMPLKRLAHTSLMGHGFSLAGMQLYDKIARTCSAVHDELLGSAAANLYWRQLAGPWHVSIWLGTSMAAYCFAAGITEEEFHDASTDDSWVWQLLVHYGFPISVVVQGPGDLVISPGGWSSTHRVDGLGPGRAQHLATNVTCSATDAAIANVMMKQRPEVNEGNGSHRSDAFCKSWASQKLLTEIATLEAEFRQKVDRFRSVEAKAARSARSSKTSGSGSVGAPDVPGADVRVRETRRSLGASARSGTGKRGRSREAQHSEVDEELPSAAGQSSFAAARKRPAK